MNLKQRAEAAIPSGVNSPVRAFKSVGQDPIYVRRAHGPYLETVDGRQLIDFCMSFGPLILGHAHPDVVEAIQKAAEKGTSFAVTTEAEIELAELIKSAIPSMEKLRLVSSGTEAAMTALRLARGFTERNKILKFSGCYHGHSDALLVQAGSGVAGIATASSSGVPEALAAETLVCPLNDLDHLMDIVDEHGHDLAAITVEPVAANMGLVMPEEGFLERLREICNLCGALLIFDEVITGFRLTFGGCQNICGVKPDITCLGKVIGGGMPIGAVGGRADIMDMLAPNGPVYQAGTLSGNPVSVAAGLATLRRLQKDDPYEELEKKTSSLVAELRSTADLNGVTVQIPQLGSLFSFFFKEGPVTSFADVQASDPEPFKRMFAHCLKNGIYLPPSPFEVCFASTEHDANVLSKAAETIGHGLR
ncbi:MAG: glutamate-1-semialdehyde 2,1-aminomutase [Verrucomicrobia bacterium]|nr:glutamate-1-semialdehyde 2,1-aminomutase [Verrucomicrobiota bacterium]